MPMPISSFSCRAMNVSRASVRSSPMPTIPAQDEFVLRELGDERVHHAGQVAFAAVHATLALVGGSVLKHLGSNCQLFSPPESPCYRLKITHELINFITQRRSLPRLAGDDARVEPVPGRAPL